MIDKLQYYAIKLKYLKPIALLLTFSSVIFIIYTVINSHSRADDTFFIPALILLLWSLTVNMMLATFPTVPEQPDKKHHSFFMRIKLRIRRSFYYVLSIIFISSSILVIMLSYKLINVWHNIHP